MMENEKRGKRETGDNATDSEIELASAVDNSDEYLSEEEINYYMNLEEK